MPRFTAIFLLLLALAQALAGTPALTAIWAESGSSLDPSGQPRTDEGGSLDPNGQPRVDEGASLDPNGQPRTDEGSSLDPSGRA
jgi:hypothetical protein